MELTSQLRCHWIDLDDPAPVWVCFLSWPGGPAAALLPCPVGYEWVTICFDLRGGVLDLIFWWQVSKIMCEARTLLCPFLENAVSHSFLKCRDSGEDPGNSCLWTYYRDISSSVAQGFCASPTPAPTLWRLFSLALSCRWAGMAQGLLLCWGHIHGGGVPGVACQPAVFLPWGVPETLILHAVYGWLVSCMFSRTWKDQLEIVPWNI